MRPKETEMESGENIFIVSSMQTVTLYRNTRATLNGH